MIGAITFCLIGSMRFEKDFIEAEEKLTLHGISVQRPAVYPSFKGGVKEWYKPHEKLTLDLVMLAKIADADGVLVVGDGYVGDSTISELRWAHLLGKRILFQETFVENDPDGNPHHTVWENVYVAMRERIDQESTMYQKYIQWAKSKEAQKN